MSSVEDRVISMTFLNSNFIKGVSTTISALGKLQSALAIPAPAKNGLDDVQDKASRFSLAGMSNATSSVSASFVAMSTVAITALSNITNKAVDSGLAFAKSLVVSPITSGLSEYETNLNSIQTILANTQGAGSTLDDVNGALAELNKYSDQTIYNFSEMASNIGTFTAAGVQLGPATSAIKGIANLAALSGSNSQQASTAMYQLSQAIASGKVGLQDWNSVVNAGMGGATFQKALANTAVQMGKLTEGAVQLDEKTGGLKVSGESFRESISAVGGGPSWLTSDVLTKTLDQFTGDMTDAQLAAMGFNAEQVKSIQQTAVTAKDAATKVKTLSQVFDVAKETTGSGWAKTFQLIFGDFEQARTTFTSMSTTINAIINAQSKARNKLLKGFDKLGGRDVAIKAFGNAFKALSSVIKPVAEAFRSIFPPTSADQLFKMVQNINHFAKSLILSDETAAKVKRTFAGLFAVVDIGVQIVKGIFGVIGDLVGSMSKGSGGVLNFTAGLGDFLVSLDKAIKKGDGLTKFFEGLGKVVAFPIHIITSLVGALFSIGDGSAGAANALGRVGDRFSFFGKIANTVKGALSSIGDFFGNLGDKIDTFAPVLAGVSKGISDAIADLISGGDFSSAFDGLNTVLFGALIVVMRNFFKNGLSFNFDAGGGLIDSIKGTFGALTGSLEALQQNIQAKTLLTIAGAVALLTVSIIGLSLIDSDKLTKALAAIGAGFALLLAAMQVMTKIAGSAGFIKIPQVAISMIILAGAILVLSLAVKILSTMSWEELAKGLGSVAVLLIGLSAAAQAMSGTSGAILRTGLAMIPLSIAILLLAGAVKIFATMSWQEIAKGMVGIAGALGIIALAMNAMPKTLPITAAGLVLVAFALTGLGGAMKLFASMSWKEMGKGLAGVAGALVLIAAGMSLMPLTLPITAAGLILVAIALEGIAAVAKTFATMSWEDMGKAAAGIAGAMVIIAAGLYLMTGTLAGSAALLVASAALAVLTPVLIALSQLSIGEIATALGALAATFLVLGVAGLLLAPVILPLLGLGAAMLLIGSGVALAGAGILALATAFGLLAVYGAAGLIVIGGLIQQVPALIISFAKGVIGFVKTIGDSAGQFVGAFAKIIGAILSAVTQALPKIGALFVRLITTALNTIRRTFPQFVATGISMLMNLLQGISNNIGKITAKASEIVQKFMGQLGKEAPKLADKGAKMIIDFVNALSTAIDNNSREMGEAGGRLAVAIVRGMANGIAGGLSIVTDAAKALAHKALDAAKNVLGIHSPSREFHKIGIFVNQGFAQGIVAGLDETRAGLDQLKTTIHQGMKDAKDAVKSEQDKLKKLQKQKAPAKKIDKQQKAVRQAKKEQEALAKADKIVLDQIKNNRAALEAEAVKMDNLQAALETRSAELETAKNNLAQYKESVSSQYNTLPEISKSTGLASYMRQMQQSIDKTTKFQQTLAALRAIGLDDTTYKKLLAEGLDAAPFAEKLLAAGPSAVSAITNLDTSLQTASGNLATQASTDMYQAAVDTAQGYVNGINSQIATVTATMEHMAEVIVAPIRKKLKIKSPSRVFAELGMFSSLGFADGITSYSHVAEKASEDVGLNSLAVLKTTMSKASDAINSADINMNPSVTPVLDLSQLTRDATKMNSLLDIQPIVADVSFGQATAISADTQAAKKAAADQAAVSSTPDVKEITFKQELHSPKYLSPIDVYRATQNQLAFAKEALSTL